MEHCEKKETLDATAKSHDHSFEVLRKSKIGNFSVVTLRVATLKIPDLVFFAIHPKFLIGTFGSRITLSDTKGYHALQFSVFQLLIRSLQCFGGIPYFFLNSCEKYCAEA